MCIRDRNIAIFTGIRQNLLNELNTYIDQLNNVFKKGGLSKIITNNSMYKNCLLYTSRCV